MKKLSRLLHNIPIIKTLNNKDIPIKSIVFDSRNVLEGDIFFAIKGHDIDGHQYIFSAIEKGAKAIVCEQIPKKTENNIIFIQVQNSSTALGLMASNYYDVPSKKINLIGITGTNGKTTITTLLYNLFTQLGFSCVLLSTIENKIGNKTLKSTHTTADPITINKLLNEAVEAQCEYAFMEVSSHGIDQNRLAGLDFNIGAFTNITHDHLDYHRTFSNYINTKKRFFDQLPNTAFAFTNLDDKNGKIMVQNTKAKIVTYSLKSNSDFKGKIIETQFDGMLLQFNGQEFWTNLTGKFNAYNELLVYGIATKLGFSSLEILTALSKLERVKGRFETFISKNGINLIIDYAHTPDALKNILDAINQIRTHNEQLIIIFGCGGNRDKEKRPEMGDIATKNSDLCILTSDNPRNEDPDAIIKDIENGVQAQYKHKYLSISNRKEAIKAAIKLAKPKDIILIAGKGHENYQEINQIKYDFDDMKITKELLKTLEK